MRAYFNFYESLINCNLTRAAFFLKTSRYFNHLN